MTPDWREYPAVLMRFEAPREERDGDADQPSEADGADERDRFGRIPTDTLYE